MRVLIKGTSVGKFSAPDRYLATYDVETGRAGKFERAEEKRLKKEKKVGEETHSSAHTPQMVFRTLLTDCVTGCKRVAKLPSSCPNSKSEAVG
jgi:hypothetical protein